MAVDYTSYESMLAARDAADWAFWSMIGTWFAGIATFGAVWVSLHIANRKPRIYLTARASLSATITGDYSQIGLGVDVANISAMPITISGIYWVDRKTLRMFQIFGDHPSAKLPTKLEYGESAFYFIGFSEHEDWLKIFKGELIRKNVNLKNLRVMVKLSSGDEFPFKLDKELLHAIENEQCE